MTQSKPSPLRVLSGKEAFYFYSSEGMSLGESAESLEDFLEMLTTICDESIDFHLGRGDFEKWIDGTLGDKTLAKQVAELRVKGLKGDRARTELSIVISKRIVTLKK